MVGTDKDISDQYVSGAVPTVPTVPTKKEKECTRGSEGGDLEVRADWEERAAILEFDCGLSRADAEARARGELDEW